MNIEKANNITMSSILERMGFKPAKHSGNNLWYLSPLRQEKTASFHVCAKQNVWYDHGEGKGGDVVNFICFYLERQGMAHTVTDALAYLENIYAFATVQTCIRKKSTDKSSPLEIRNVSSIKNEALKGYLETRGIHLRIAKKHLKEVHVQNLNTGKTFFALGFQNEDGGYELRNKFFKGSIAPKSISFVRGAKVLPEGIHVFEGFMDFLSALHYQENARFEDDAIILNSTSKLAQAFPYIKNYGYKRLHGWLDNNIAGEKATKALQSFAENEADLFFRRMNNSYKPYDDVNAWHMKRLGL